MNKYNLQRVQLAAQPILPTFSEVFQRSPWVYYGGDNLMPQYLISRYNNSAIHKAIVIAKKEQVIGDGMTANNPMSTVNLVNSKENIYEVYKKCALDLILFGGYALNVIWSRDKKSIAEIYHLDFSRVRSGKINPETDEIETYYYSPDWSNTRKFPPQDYPSFNQKEDNPSQIIYYKSYSPDTSYYPTPDYSGALAAIEIDVQIKEFHSNNLRNGLSPGLWINLNNGVPSEEEQRIVARGLEEQFGSVNNAGRPIVSFNESKELAPDIVQIPKNSNDSYYEALYDDVVRTILSGHRVGTGELFSISTANKLGSKDEISTHIAYFYSTVIKPYQRELLTTFNKLATMKFGEYIEYEIKPIKIFEDDVVNEDTPNPNNNDNTVNNIE